MNTPDITNCDCIDIDHEDYRCVAASAMDRTLAEVIEAERRFLDELIRKYGPSENTD